MFKIILCLCIKLLPKWLKKYHRIITFVYLINTAHKTVFCKQMNLKDLPVSNLIASVSVL